MLITNRNDSVSLLNPFDDYLLREGVHFSVAVKLYEEDVLTLAKAARLAKNTNRSFHEETGQLWFYCCGSVYRRTCI